MSFDRGASLGLFLFGAGALYLSMNIPKTAIRQTVGPEVMPAGIALALMLASVVLFIQSFGAQRATAQGGELPEGIREDRRTQGLVLLGMAIYLVVFEPLGYVVSTALLCIYETAVFQTGHWVRNVLSGVGFAVVVYTIFVKLLEVLLPVGILGW